MGWMGMKLQIGIDYIMVFASSAAVVFYVVVVNFFQGTSVGLSLHSSPLMGDNSCASSSTLQCYSVSADSSTGSLIVQIRNTNAATVKFPESSFKFSETGPSSGQFVGDCTPVTAQAGQNVTCAFSAGSGAFFKGQKVTGTLSVGYNVCSSGSCSTKEVAYFNTTVFPT